MKFLELTKMLKKLEENKNSLLLVKCGAFFVAIKEDAAWLSINLGLKKTCKAFGDTIQKQVKK